MACANTKAGTVFRCDTTLARFLKALVRKVLLKGLRKDRTADYSISRSYLEHENARIGAALIENLENIGVEFGAMRSLSPTVTLNIFIPGDGNQGTDDS